MKDDLVRDTIEVCRLVLGAALWLSIVRSRTKTAVEAIEAASE
jgi:hypothetical protein